MSVLQHIRTDFDFLFFCSKLENKKKGLCISFYVLSGVFLLWGFGLIPKKKKNILYVKD